MRDSYYYTKNLSKSNSSVWIGIDYNRFFLVPLDITLPKGSFKLRSINKNKFISVDETTLIKYEINKIEAENIIKDHLKQTLSSLSDKISKITIKSGFNKSHSDEDYSKRKMKTPGLDLLAYITNSPRENIGEDYKSTGRALSNYLKDIILTIGDAISPKPERKKAAIQRMQFWQETLKKHEANKTQSKCAATESEKYQQNHSKSDSCNHKQKDKEDNSK